MGDGLGAAAGRDVLVGGGGDEAGLGQCLAGATGRVVPAAAGATRDQEVDFAYLGLDAEAGAQQAAEQSVLEGSLQHDVLLVIVAKRLINGVWLENNLAVMAIKAVLPILFIVVMGREGTRRQEGGGLN